MLQQLINHSQDLRKLRDQGYEIEITGGYLLIHQIPYVNSLKEIKRGVLVSTLDLKNNQETAQPKTHVVFFKGEFPCYKDGSGIQGIKHQSETKSLAEGVNINYSFSNKPLSGYKDYFEKMTRYIDIISHPAKSIDQSITARTFKVYTDESEDALYHYIDTNSSRANIDLINSKLKGQRIGIVGLGGTGAYILDQVAKTHVQEIHLFDGDDFFMHNAFRSPGAASKNDLDQKWKKVHYYNEMYSKMRKNIYAHDIYINDQNINLLENFSFIFLCIDKEAVKKDIISFLLNNKIPFVDVGLGVNIANNALIGTLRTTTGTIEKNDHLFKKIPHSDDLENEYSSNIQIAELNALNAIFAVIKWKKLFGFYLDDINEHNSLFTISLSQLINEDIKT
jgi:molybdopterin/thiamine biosynthesis adenylyltransferase